MSRPTFFVVRKSILVRILDIEVHKQAFLRCTHSFNVTHKSSGDAPSIESYSCEVECSSRTKTICGNAIAFFTEWGVPFSILWTNRYCRHMSEFACRAHFKFLQEQRVSRYLCQGKISYEASSVNFKKRRNWSKCMATHSQDVSNNDVFCVEKFTVTVCRFALE